jgi:hypothetical protein
MPLFVRTLLPSALLPMPRALPALCLIGAALATVPAHANHVAVIAPKDDGGSQVICTDGWGGELSRQGDQVCVLPLRSSRPKCRDDWTMPQAAEALCAETPIPARPAD